MRDQQLTAAPFNLDAAAPGVFYVYYQEADNFSNNQALKRSTMDGGSRYDYIFRANPASMSDDALIEPIVYSDLHWYQMFL